MKNSFGIGNNFGPFLAVLAHVEEGLEMDGRGREGKGREEEVENKGSI